MNKKFKFLTVLLALVMTLGAFAPFSARAEGEKTEETTKTVTLHKLVMSKEDLGKWDSDAIEKKGYNGTQNTDALKALLDAGHSAKEVAGVYFAVKDSDGYVTIKEVEGQKAEYGRVATLDTKPADGFKLLAGKTEAGGITFNTSGLKGDFEIVEVHEKSTYVGENGEAITDSKAVPVEITLPLVNNDGVVVNAHVYPKNTEDKPQIDKNFLKNNELTAAEQEAADKLKVGADYKNYQAKKATAKAEIGKNVPYEVQTEIPAKSKLAEAHWDDKMTEGLTYNKDLKVTIGGTEITLSKDELVQTDNGFSLRLKGDNLALLNNKDTAVTVELKYSATVNSNAIADIPDANDITFHYGNTPSKGTTPVPTKPNDSGKITVVKTWDDGSEWAEGEYAIFKLVDANTGEDVKVDDLVEPTKEEDKAAFEKYKAGFKGTVKLEKAGETSHSWEYLNKDKSYKAVEIESKTLSDAEYKVNEKGKIEVTDHKSNNPKPLNPTEPKVVTGGKKFVKTNQEKTERLAGAEFYVKNKAGQYLVIKTKDDSAKEAAKKALDEAVKAYNNLTAEEQKDEAKVTAAKNLINEKQAAYNEAFIEAAKNYTWEDASTNAIVLTSNAEGQFEIKGLEYGTYYLEEKTAPKGYAKLNGPIEFEVKEGSYTGVDCDINYEQDQKQVKDAKCVANKKVSIPQTGGIGTVIFTVVGVMLMVGAAFALKRRKEDELEGLA